MWVTKPRKANESACPSSVTANPVLIPVYQTIFYCMLTGLQLTLRGMSEALVDKRVAPALVTLSSDPELWVPQTATLSYTVCPFEHSSWSAFFNLICHFSTLGAHQKEITRCYSQWSCGYECFQWTTISLNDCWINVVILLWCQVYCKSIFPIVFSL